jgi:hypothetical protein
MHNEEEYVDPVACRQLWPSFLIVAQDMDGREMCAAEQAFMGPDGYLRMSALVWASEGAL